MKGKLHHKLGIFGAVPLSLLRDRTVTGTELRVYIALSSFEGTKAESYPSVRTIADRAGISKSSVSPATASLSCKGWVKVTRRGQGQSNVYECLSFSDRVREAQSKLAREWKKDSSGKFKKTGPSEFKDSVGSDGKKTGPVGNKKTTSKDHRGKAPPSVPHQGAVSRAPASTPSAPDAYIVTPSLPFGKTGETPLHNLLGDISPAREKGRRRRALPALPAVNIAAMTSGTRVRSE